MLGSKGPPIFRKWHMGYQMVTRPMTSRDPKGAVRQYGRLSWWQLGFLFKCLHWWWCYGILLQTS